MSQEPVEAFTRGCQACTKTTALQVRCSLHAPAVPSPALLSHQIFTATLGSSVSRPILQKGQLRLYLEHIPVLILWASVQVLLAEPGSTFSELAECYLTASMKQGSQQTSRAQVSGSAPPYPEFLHQGPPALAP